MSILKVFIPIIILLVVTLVSIRNAVVSSFPDPTHSVLAANISEGKFDAGSVKSDIGTVCDGQQPRGDASSQRTDNPAGSADAKTQLAGTSKEPPLAKSSESAQMEFWSFELVGWFNRELQVSKSQQKAAAKQVQKLRASMNAEFLGAVCVSPGSL